MNEPMFSPVFVTQEQADAAAVRRLVPGPIEWVPADPEPATKRDLAHVPTDKLKSLAETYERKLKIIGGAGNPEATKLRFRFEFVMQEIGIRQIVEDVEADLAKVGQ